MVEERYLIVNGRGDRFGDMLSRKVCRRVEEGLEATLG